MTRRCWTRHEENVQGEEFVPLAVTKASAPPAACTVEECVRDLLDTLTLDAASASKETSTVSARLAGI